MDQYISSPYEGSIFNVVGNFNKANHPLTYKKGKGYIFDDGVVRVYSLTKRVDRPIPYFWFDETEKTYLKGGMEFDDGFTTDRIVSITPPDISKNTPDDFEPFNEEAINAINAAAEIYKPEIKPGDDPLKKIIKTAIIEKQINISRLSANVDTKCRLNNMKSALTKETKMSIEYFNKWCELLGLDYMVMLVDNGVDTIDPLKEPVVYRSELDLISVGELDTASRHHTIRKKGDE